MSSTIAVAVLNWNGKSLLQTYLPSVIKDSAPHKVYVIDNNSSDESLVYLNENHPEVTIIHTGENLGYAGGYNEGLKAIQEPISILLNSDVRTTPGWLNPIFEHFENHPDCAALQPKIRWDRSPEQFEYAGASGGFIDRWAYPFCRGRVFGTLENDIGQYNTPREVFWATGACLAVRTDVFKAIGGLDPMLFAHMEEIDLCWRMQRAGFEVWVQPESTVYHLGGATLSADNPKKTFLNFRNNLIIVMKNLPHFTALRVIFIRLILDGLAGIQFLLAGKPKHTFAIIRAHFAFYSKFTGIQRARARTAKYPFKRFRDLKGTYPNSVVWQYYSKGKKRFSDFY